MDNVVSRGAQVGIIKYVETHNADKPIFLGSRSTNECLSTFLRYIDISFSVRWGAEWALFE